MWQAMTINKAQGQTLKRVGIIGECFTHGQMYVAASLRRSNVRLVLPFVVQRTWMLMIG